MSPFGDLFDWATKIDVDDTDLVFFNEPPPDLCKNIRLIVPDLNSQWSRLILDAPKAIWVFRFVFVQPNKSPCIDHLRGLEARSTKFSYHLSERKISETRHRCLEDGGIHRDRADMQGLDIGEWRGRNRAGHEQTNLVTKFRNDLTQSLSFISVGCGSRPGTGSN